MAGDLTDCASLARHLEFNASRVRFTFDEIIRKYDRPFPHDDVIDLCHHKIVRDNGAVKFMPIRKIGCISQRKHHGPRAETPSPLESLVESRLDTRSPESEKSFISVNCSRYVTDMGVESEPSDAETITSGSDDNDSDDDNNGSWEEERTGSTQSASEEADDAGGGADWYMSEPGSQQASELCPEEEGKWLSLDRQEYLSRRQRRGYHTDKQHEHGHGQTRASHHNVRHGSAEKRMGAHSAEPSFAHHRAHTSLMSGSRHGMFLQSTGHQTHRWGSARRTLQGSSSTPSPLKDRVGLPRRVVPVQLFQQEDESKTQSSDGSEEVVTDEFSKDSTHDKEPSREMLLSSSLSDAGDEVDSSLLAGQQKGLIHPGIQPIMSRAPASQKDGFFERRGNYALTGMTATQCCTRAQETGAALNEGSTTSADTRPTAGLLQGGRYNVPFHLQTFDTTYTVSPQSSPKRTVFDSIDRRKDMFLMSYCEKDTSKTSSPSKERLMANAPSEGLYHYRRVPLQSEQDTRNTGDVEAELSNQNSLIKRANDVEIGPGHDSEPLRQQRSSVITAGKKNVPEVRTGKAIPHDSSVKGAEDILPPTGNGYKASTDMTTSGIGSQSSTMILLTPNKSDSPFKPSHGSVEMSPLVELQEKLEILAKNITPRKASSASCTLSNAEKDCNNARGDKTYCFGTSDGGDKNDHESRTPAKLIPSDPIKANFCSPCKPVSSANTSFVPFTSPLPLVKIESPQQWLEVKRRFRPTCKPISAQEIKQVLEMPNATSVVTFLKQKYCKTEPSSPCREKNSNAFLQSAVQSETVNVRPSIPTQQSSFTTNGKVLAFTEERSTVRIPTELVDPKSTQVNQESSTVRRSSTPKPNRKAIPLSGISSPDSTPHRGDFDTAEVDRIHPTLCAADQEPVGGSQLFRASPGEIFRLTITTPPQPPKQRSKEVDFEADDSCNYSEAAHCRASAAVEKLRTHHCNNETFCVSSSSPDRRSELKSQVSGNAHVQPSPFSAEQESLTLPKFPSDQPQCQNLSLDSLQDNEQRRMSGSAIHEVFLKLKQASETKKTFRSAASAHYANQQLQITDERSVQGAKQSQNSRSAPISKEGRQNLPEPEQGHSPSNPTHTSSKPHGDFMDFLSDKDWSLRRQEKFLASRESTGSPLSLLSKLDAAKGKACGQTQNSVERGRRSGAYSMNTLSDFEGVGSPEKLSVPKMDQQAIPTAVPGTVLRGKEIGHDKPNEGWLSPRPWKPSRIPAPNLSAQNSICGTNSLPAKAQKIFSPMDPVSSSHMYQHRAHMSQNLSVEMNPGYSSPEAKSNTSQNQSLEASQNQTPSKLIADLTLGEGHRNLSLTQNCAALSRLLLVSPTGRKLSTGSETERQTSGTVNSDDIRSIILPVSGSSFGRQTGSSTTGFRGLASERAALPKKTVSRNVLLSNAGSPTQESRTHKSALASRPSTLSNAEGSLSTQKLSSREKQLIESEDSGKPSKKDLSTAKSNIAERLVHVKDSTQTVGQLMSRGPDWTIFKSRNPKSTDKPITSGTRPGSQQTHSSERVVFKPSSCKGSKMIHISSPRAKEKHVQDHRFSFNSVHSPSAVAPSKRSFEQDFVSSPLKRRRLTTIHAVSTPTKTGLPSPVMFDMDESLSTIAGDDSDLNSTVHSTDDCTLDDSNSCSDEDEVTLISD